MRASFICKGSLLLQHIHRSLPVLQRVYASLPSSPLQARGGVSGTAMPADTHVGATPTSSSPASSPALSTSAFPRDPHTSAEGDDVLCFFCAELGMGEKPLRLWRRKLQQRMRQRWGLREEGNESSVPTTPEDVAALPWTSVQAATTTTTTATSTTWLRPRLQDAAVVRSAMRDLKFLVSPLLLLSPPPCLSSTATGPPLLSSSGKCQSAGGQGCAPHRLQRPTTHEECSRWYATQPIPAGMFLMSIPTEAVLFAHPPPASDPLLTFFMHVEELAAQLVDAAATPSAPHHGYVSYLCDSVVPCANLPFLTPTELRETFEKEARSAPSGGVVGGQRRNGTAPAAAAAAASARDIGESGEEGASVLDSPALSLLSFFHEDMSGEPLSDYLRARLSKDEYAWWVSLVLSHRAGASSLLPMIDKLNHSPLPNSYYTMATEETVCGLDVLDNLFAGVPGALLYQPYVHVFAIRDIAAGEEVTLCYASAAEAAYRPAGVHPPRRPTSLQAPTPSPDTPRTEAGGHVSDGADLQEVMDTLFASAIGAAAGGQPRGAAAAQLQHAGRQEVSTAEGSASWRLQWGFVPACDAVYSAKDLMEVAGLVAEHRVDTRARLFPPAPRTAA